MTPNAPAGHADGSPTGPLGSARLGSRAEVVWVTVRRSLAVPGAYRGDRAEIVDIGGGTGGFAVPLATLGHRVLVIDPNPDALAALGRRADEAGVTDLITAHQGEVADITAYVERFAATDGPDLVLCHEVLEVLADPASALTTIVRALRPGGALSLLVPGLHAAVVARAMAGHFNEAIALLDEGVGRRFTAHNIAGMLTDVGLVIDSIHAARVFTDLGPGAFVDSEPGATRALLELERAVAARPEYLTLATHLHVFARRTA
ncbi:MAG: methyltransferase domain-containing protein [Nocardioides sp.]